MRTRRQMYIMMPKLVGEVMINIIGFAICDEGNSVNKQMAHI